MASQAPIRVMCVDDHPMVLEGISSFIGKQPDMDLVATATSGEQAVVLFRQLVPDLTLMDLRLPGMSGLEAIRRIRAVEPHAKIIVLTMFHGDEDIHRALNAGASTYLLKDVNGDDLLRIVREVNAGARPLPRSVADVLTERETQPVLTAREAEVMQLIARGLRNRDIAVQLGLSEETVKSHVKSILTKFDATDRAGAISVAAQRGFVHFD